MISLKLATKLCNSVKMTFGHPFLKFIGSWATWSEAKVQVTDDNRITSVTYALPLVLG